MIRRKTADTPLSRLSAAVLAPRARHPVTMGLALAAACYGPSAAADTPADAPPPPATVLPSVTVTAEKSDRSLQDTATSVIVFDADQLDRRPGLSGSNDILSRIPNITSAGAAAGRAPTVRGVDGTGPSLGADAFFAGSRPRLNVQVDGRPASFNEVVYGDNGLWDVDQVEVLRGPQSTLQGRNAIAGTLTIKTMDPSFQRDGSVRAIAGDEGNRQAAFYLTGPLAQSGAGEQFAYRLAGEYQTRDSVARGYTPFPGVGDPGQYESRTLRGKLLFESKTIEGFRTLLTLNHADYRAPQQESFKRPFSQRIAAYPAMPVFEPRTSSGILDTQWQFRASMRLENLLSLTDVNVKRRAMAGDGIANIDSRELVWEPRLRFNGERARGVAGAYLFRGRQHEFIDIPGDQRFHDRVDTYAVFGETTLGLREDLDLTLGGRYEREQHRRHGGDGTAVRIAVDETDGVFLPKLGVAWRANERTTYGVVAGRGYNGGGGGVTLGVPIVNYEFDPEYVWNYEAYFRSELAGGRLRLTGNVFYSEYRDMQLPFDLNPDPRIWSVVTRNADEAVTYGAEVGVRWLARRGLELHADLGWLHTDVVSYPGSNIEGNELAEAPSFTAQFGVQYRNDGGWELSLDGRYSNGYFSTLENHPLGKVDAYWLLNAQAGYRFNERARLFVYANNLLDTDDVLSLELGATRADDVALLQSPRSVGVGLQWWF